MFYKRYRWNTMNRYNEYCYSCFDIVWLLIDIKTSIESKVIIILIVFSWIIISQNLLFLRTRRQPDFFFYIEIFTLFDLNMSLFIIRKLFVSFSFILLCIFRRHYLYLFEISTVTFRVSCLTLDILSTTRKRKLWFEWRK